MHYSTFIEAKRLTLSQAKAAHADANLQIAGLVHYQFVTIHPLLRRQRQDGSPAENLHPA